ncbi:hypothetical protein [Xanthobacter versatilis]|uniref:hypothetical protein n=1 Tax=Xanthobacter autotrophicus (strain ATCC BAA-1158 / Py2) TaxID=78245 RepID=UPI00372993CD
MKIYATGFRAFETARVHVYVTPGARRESDPVEWWVGETPRMYDVEFNYGAAEVPDELGKYMLDHGMAGRSKVVIPRAVA